MFTKHSTRREFVRCGGLFFLLLLSSCRNSSQRVKIALQNSFYPDSFKDIIPNNWQQNNFNFGSINKENNVRIILDSEFISVNDGWLDKVDFNQFKTIDESYFLDKLDRRSKDFLNTFEENKRYKLFPIGVVPYAVIIKNNKDLINSARKSWDFLLSKKLTKKIILPNSPRIILSIAEKINASNSLDKLKKQAMLFDDQNILNWLINSDARVAIVPFSLCSKYFKLDTRLSVVFPNQGVPLMWHFILTRTNQKNGVLIDWIESLENKSIIDKLSNQGWYLPYKNYYSQSKFRNQISSISGPSLECWEKSWSFPQLSNIQKLKLENLWNNSLTP